MDRFDNHVIDLTVGSWSDETTALLPWLWHACKDPDRPIDVACLFDSRCDDCDAEYQRRGCPLPEPLPPLPVNAPRIR